MLLTPAEPDHDSRFFELIGGPSDGDVGTLGGYGGAFPDKIEPLSLVRLTALGASVHAVQVETYIRRAETHLYDFTTIKILDEPDVVRGFEFISRSIDESKTRRAGVPTPGPLTTRGA